MLSRSLRRLLKPVASELLYQSTDPEDPRLGNLVRLLDDGTLTADAVVVVVGVPQHIGIERNHGRAGAAEAPAAIRSALYKMATSAVQDALLSKSLIIVDAGDVRPEGRTLEQIHDVMHDVVRGLLNANVIPIILGGGHDVAWPTLRAYETLGEPYGVINIDAHADVRPMLPDSRAHSGSPFRQMLDTANSCRAQGAFVEYGLQTHAVARAHLAYVREHGGTVFMLDEARQAQSWEAAMKIVRVGNRVHVSLDMDGFASAYAPGVSAPSADGFAPWEIGPQLRSAAASHSLSSFDVVEVSPPFDSDGRTSKLAATMIMQVLAGVADRCS